MKYEEGSAKTPERLEQVILSHNANAGKPASSLVSESNAPSRDHRCLLAADMLPPWPCRQMQLKTFPQMSENVNCRRTPFALTAGSGDPLLSHASLFESASLLLSLMFVCSAPEQNRTAKDKIRWEAEGQKYVLCLGNTLAVFHAG